MSALDASSIATSSLGQRIEQLAREHAQLKADLQQRLSRLPSQILVNEQRVNVTIEDKEQLLDFHELLRRLKFLTIELGCLGIDLRDQALPLPDYLGAPPGAPTLLPVVEQRAERYNPCAVAISPDDAFLVESYRSQYRLGISRLRVGHPIQRIYTLDTRARGHIRRVRFSPDGLLVAASFGDRGCQVYTFDAQRNALVATITSGGLVCSHLCFTADGQHLITGAGSMLRLLRIDHHHATLRELMAGFHISAVRGLAASPDNRHLAVAGDHGSITFYTLDLNGVELHQRHSLPVPAQELRATPPRGLAFSPDGSLLAIGYGDQLCLHAIDVPGLAANRCDLITLKELGGPILDLAFMRDNNHLVVASRHVTRIYRLV